MRTFRVGEQADRYQQGLVVLPAELGKIGWSRGQTVLSKKKGGSIVRGGHDEEDEEYNRTAKRNTLSDVLLDFAKAAQTLVKPTGAQTTANDESGLD